MVQTLERAGCQHGLSLHPEFSTIRQNQLETEQNKTSEPDAGKTLQITSLRA